MADSEFKTALQLMQMAGIPEELARNTLLRVSEAAYQDGVTAGTLSFDEWSKLYHKGSVEIGSILDLFKVDAEKVTKQIQEDMNVVFEEVRTIFTTKTPK